MPNYRRARIAGGTYFFTVVTDGRREILTLARCREALRTAIAETRKLHPFVAEAWVLLPDHLHCIWTLPVGDEDYSKRWGLIKAGFSKRVRGSFCQQNDSSNVSKKKHREASFWQRRFWEHAVRDDEDFRRHVNYIHYNPVKHGLVKRARDWPYSTFRRFVEDGVYPEDWGGGEAANLADGFGE